MVWTVGHRWIDGGKQIGRPDPGQPVRARHRYLRFVRQKNKHARLIWDSKEALLLSRLQSKLIGKWLCPTARSFEKKRGLSTQ